MEILGRKLVIGFFILTLGFGTAFSAIGCGDDEESNGSELEDASTELDSGYGDMDADVDGESGEGGEGGSGGASGTEDIPDEDSGLDDDGGE